MMLWIWSGGGVSNMNNDGDSEFFCRGEIPRVPVTLR